MPADLQPRVSQNVAVTGEATMAAWRDRLPTIKELLILAIVAVAIATMTVAASRWEKWFSSNEPRILIAPAH